MIQKFGNRILHVIAIAARHKDRSSYSSTVTWSLVTDIGGEMVGKWQALAGRDAENRTAGTSEGGHGQAHPSPYDKASSMLSRDICLAVYNGW